MMLEGSGRQTAMSARDKTSDLFKEGALRIVFTIQKDDLDGGYIAECADLPGCISQGETQVEAAANLADAIAGYLAVVIEDHLQKHHAVTVTQESTDQESFVIRPLVALSSCAD
jgi:predicted RNase H-like HicB family nuclease